ncbi:MAG: DUF362 domain-containing protein [Pleomorphochaeta sp.]
MKKNLQIKKSRKILIISTLYLLVAVSTLFAQGTKETVTINNTLEENSPSHSRIDLNSLEHLTTSKSAPIVYMTEEITSQGLMNLYKTLDVSPEGNVAIKLHSGEGDGSYNLRPEFIKSLVDEVNATIVECNTAYGGARATTALHMQVAKDHGYLDIAPFDIMDADGGMEIPVIGGTRLKTNEVGAHFNNYDFFIILSHFKGHMMGGFGGALKNMSIGIASSEGKSLIHTGGESRTGIGFRTPVDTFTEAMAEAAKSVSDYLDNGKNIIYINVMNNLSVDCDCVANPAKPDMHDIGIFASTDPVALDQACVDLIYASPDGQSVINRIESRNGTHVLEHADEIGFGSREYRLVSID